MPRESAAVEAREGRRQVNDPHLTDAFAAFFSQRQSGVTEMAKKRHLTDAFAAFFSPRYVIPFLVGAITVGVLGNAVYQLLTNMLGTNTGAVLLIIVSTLLVLLVAVGLVVWQAGRPAPFRPMVNPWRQSPQSRRGLIFLFGRREVCKEALAAHEKTLERLWLVCTPQSNTAANEFAGELGPQGAWRSRCASSRMPMTPWRSTPPCRRSFKTARKTGPSKT
jgi:hypothetical protein